MTQSEILAFNNEDLNGISDHIISCLLPAEGFMTDLVLSLSEHVIGFWICLGCHVRNLEFLLVHSFSIMFFLLSEFQFLLQSGPESGHKLDSCYWGHPDLFLFISDGPPLNYPSLNSYLLCDASGAGHSISSLFRGNFKQG